MPPGRPNGLLGSAAAASQRLSGAGLLGSLRRRGGGIPPRCCALSARSGRIAPERTDGKRWASGGVGEVTYIMGLFPAGCAGFCTAVTLLGSVTCADGIKRSVLLKSTSNPESLFLLNCFFFPLGFIDELELSHCINNRTGHGLKGEKYSGTAWAGSQKWSWVGASLSANKNCVSPVWKLYLIPG